jgi:hypothetical protein
VENKSGSTPSPDSEESSRPLHDISLEDIVRLLRETPGLDLPSPRLTAFATFRLKLLEPYRIQPDIKRLESWGVKKETLALVLMAINLAPGFDYFLRERLGNKQVRQKQAKMLLAPLPVLGQFSEISGRNTQSHSTASDFFPDPERLAQGLKVYASMLTWADELWDAMGVHSFQETTKYAFAGFVKRVSGKYHDKEVSALTGAALQREDYDETAHRVWRIRNYPRLDKAIPFAALFAVAFNTVLSDSPKT